MLLIARIFTLVMLGGIVWQDARSRSVYWLYFPALAISFGLMKSLGEHRALWPDLLLNLIVIFIKLGILTIVLSIRRHRIVRIWDGMLGTGDILFFIVIAFYLSILNFIVFDVVSQVLIVWIWQIYKIYLKQSVSVPLAGIQAFFLILILAGDWWWLHLGTSGDNWLLEPLLLWNPLKPF